MTPGKIHSVGDETEGTTLRLRRRLLAVLTTCCALVLASGTAGLAAPAPAPRAGAATASSFVIATYNIRHALSDAVATADVTRLAATGVDVIALQEMGAGCAATPSAPSSWTATTCEFRAYMPEGAGPAESAVPVPGVRVRAGQQGHRAGLRTHVRRSRRRRGSTMGPKYLTYVQLRHVATARTST